jgi:hypothetical protein
MRTNWALGVALGIFIGAFALEGGVLVLLLLVPALIWGLRSRTPGAAAGGLFVGAGLGALGLIGLAQSRCVNVSGPNFSTSCTPPDLTPYVVAAAALIAVGIVLAAAAAWRVRTQR